MEAERDIIIIGGGPAGLTAAQYGARANLDTLLIEESVPGGQALNITELENYPGFPEPVSGAELCSKMEAQAKKFGAGFLNGSVVSVKKEGDIFTVKTDKQTFTSYAVILASGAEHRKLGIEGEEQFLGRGVSYCAACDGFFFRNKKIVAVGGGDTACSEALALAKLSDKIIMIHRREKFRAQKALAERVLKNKNIEVRFNTVCLKIEGNIKTEKVLLEEKGKIYEEEADAVFIFAGMIPRNSLAENLKKDADGYIITDGKMETSLKGMFAAGDIRASSFRQVVTACSDGAIASHNAALLVNEIKGDIYL